jgi:uncharacterized SAM-binding protein YcdF (DUF218 family)
VLRTATLARRAGFDAQVVGAPTARYYVPSAFLPDFVAVVVEYRWWHLGLVLPILLPTLLLVLALTGRTG